MKIIVYYLLLLIFIALLAGFIIQGRADMSMKQMVSISVLLGLYVVGMSLAGEGQAGDEREVHHRYVANRAALICGTIVLSAGVLYQLFNHSLDSWLLVGLVTINLVKIISLIYASYRR